MRIQYGCGLCAPESWVNFDSSPTITLQRIPLFGKIFRIGKYPNFPKNIRKGNIVKGLPVGDESADAVYCSHVLEHLSLEEFRIALAETRRILKKGGTFRFVLPDFEAAMNEYANSTEEDRASRFLEKTLLGTKRRQTSLPGFFKEWLGGSKHHWMWDFAGIRKELMDAGFSDVRRAGFGDSKISDFKEVEEEGRWTTGCLGVECKKLSSSPSLNH